jgi:F0F1-type ATP synthase gamma subunit
MKTTVPRANCRKIKAATVNRRNDQARQAQITKEISEISGGAGALK